MSESFLGMDMEVRGCQNDEPLEDCTTREYVDTILQKCGCLPLMLSEKVSQRKVQKKGMVKKSVDPF